MMAGSALIAAMPPHLQPGMALALAVREAMGSPDTDAAGWQDGEHAAAMLSTLDRLGWTVSPKADQQCASPAERMRLPNMVTETLFAQLSAQVARQREPDFIIGGAESPYLRRWWLMPRGDGESCYLHHFLRSDDDRALHDHPYASTSIILRGSYIEHLADGTAPLRQPGEIIHRADARASHRVELKRDERGQEMPVWTLFVCGPRVRDWGFHCPQGWRPWQEFVSARDKGAVGRGCE